ncbi:MAG: sigma-70 family RNA polymerase sigma factor [Bacteroidales bacterium]|nr:sigma-70 family RNA polymerase sigma factor [Bacteroidales bacterium]
MEIKEFEIEIIPLKDKAFRLARRILSGAIEAEDVVQEVLARLWRRKNKLSQYESVEALAMVMTRNLCLDHLKLKANNNLPLENHVRTHEGPNPYHQLEYDDLLKNVSALMNQLPEQQKSIMHLRDVEGYDYEEIGDVLGMNVNAVRVNLSRARKTVREGLLKIQTYESLNEKGL